MSETRSILDVIGKCCQLALRQPLSDKQLILLTEISFHAAGYAVLTEDDANQKLRQHTKPMPQ